MAENSDTAYAPCLSNSPRSMTTLIPTLTLVHRSFFGPNRGPHTELTPTPTSQQEPQHHSQDLLWKETAQNNRKP